MTDDRLRCPRCHSADIVTGPHGEQKCEECRFLVVDESYQSTPFLLDDSGNMMPLDREGAARHKRTLAKAARQPPPIIVGINPQEMRERLSTKKREAIANYCQVPWYRPDLKCKYRTIAATVDGVAKIFTGEPV